MPKPLLKAFDWPDIRSRVTVDAVISLADATAVAAGQFAPDLEALERQRMSDESLDHETPLSEVFEDQIFCADIVLLTKADLASPKEMLVAKKKISGITVRTLPVIEVVNGKVDPRLILGLEAAAEDDLSSRPSHHDNLPDHDHEDFESGVFVVPESRTVEEIKMRVERLTEEQRVLRVKGYVAISGKPMRMVVQAVGNRVRTQFDRMWTEKETRVGQLVVIAEHNQFNYSEIEKILVG